MSTHLRHYRRFAQYNAWFNGRLFGLVSTLTEEQRRRDMGAFFRSIHGTLQHILLTDRIWLGRVSRHAHGFRSLEKTPLVFEFESLAQILYERFDELAAQRSETDRAIQAWVAELTPELLDSELSYSRSNGESMVAPLWHVVSHLFNHQTHHRGQITTLLSQLGCDPGVTDFMITVFMPEVAG